ncbi:MAG: hypothetical protein CMF55_00360 [Legionellales bacterium]|nr:hypothetical protein [Legionellales bacterium]
MKIITIKGFGACIRTGREFYFGEKVAFISGEGLVCMEALTDEDKAKKNKKRVLKGEEIKNGCC